MLDLPFNHTVSLILITVVVSLIAFSNQKVMSRLIFWPPAMQRGQYDRFVTHGFVHADGAHLIFNMITLFFFGSVIESFYRQYFFDLGFVLFYLGGLIVAIIPSYLKHKNDHRWNNNDRYDHNNNYSNRVNPRREWRSGQYLPSQFSSSRYHVNYKNYRQLPKPGKYQQWYKVNGDYVLVNERNNRIVRVFG